jgi:branched-chain amino acid transport system substrate-binding protein
MKKMTFNQKLSVLASSILLSGLTIQAQAQTSDTIKLGMTTALTGPFNEFGEGNRRGVVLAIEMFNKNGGVNGKKGGFGEKTTKNARFHIEQLAQFMH